MKWKEPTFGPTPLLKALMGANARRKAQAADLEGEQKKLNLTYPDWAKDWIRKYKEAWYMAEACGDKEGMKRAAKLAEGFRDKLRAMEKMPTWAQEQMQKQTVRWMEANEVGNVREMKAAGEAGQGIRDKLIMIDHIGKKSPENAKRLNDLTAKWYAANDRGIVDGKNMSDKPSEVKKAKDNYSNEAQKLMEQYPLPQQEPKKEEVPSTNQGTTAPPANQGTHEGFSYEWTGIHVTPEFKTKVLDICKKLQINPDDLMAIMAFESGGINPAAVNRKSGATGLIQFMPSTAASLGTSTSALAKMSAVEQLDYVYKYFKPYAGRIHNVYDAYMVVFLPIGVGKDDDFVLGQKDSTEILAGKLTKGKVYAQNSGLDVNGDFKITKKEAGQKVINTRNQYKKIK
ncbi:transglycosylase SLT domain-containing protein [Paenibacillus elgii]|uniref:transglycosylase SLT domain-containing protein n=1 Tax=Paenibacillus elgii TaxID=189691 RepID=UPI000FDA0E42|nr:transglycosylase SLT domain-containing protein [Paenibacillus elgii]NEN80894.1 transglycosylase SLT domain-containing protein [Paenibacillus elgii]